MKTLEIDSVNLSFGQKEILKDIYLKCAVGDIIGLIGRNGSGKSCLMKIIFGTLKAQYQSVRLNGIYKNCLYKTPGAIQYLPQNGFLMPYLCFNDLIKIFNLESDLSQIFQLEEIRINRAVKIGQLSAGIKKLMEIITVLYGGTAFVLLDEPFSFLSPLLVEKVTPIIKLQSLHKGIILTDHQHQSVFSICNNYFLLSSGALKKIEHKSELYDLGYLSSER